MRLISLFFLLVFTIACGKDGGGSSSGSATNELCSSNGRTVACRSITGDGLGVDLLEAMIDVPVKIQDTELTFLADKSAASTGRRISCKASVKNGEMYRIALRGNKLLVMTGEGSFEMDRLNDGSDISGTWVWKGYIDQGVHIIKQITFLNSSRVIMRTSCEL